MDLRQYFRRLREIEASIADQFPTVVTLETPDGGRAGVMRVVSREIAAAMIAEGRATLASEEEKEVYRLSQVEEKKAAEKAEIAKRVQVAIVADPEIQAQFSGKRPAGK